MLRLPFGERVLWDSPALSSSPGHTPIHEDKAFSESKLVASAPTSAIIWIAESTPKPGTSATRFRPRGPRLDLAWHRCSVPDILVAPSRFWRSGFQNRSSAPHTGFQYCAVDSM